MPKNIQERQNLTLVASGQLFFCSSSVPGKGLSQEMFREVTETSYEKVVWQSEEERCFVLFLHEPDMFVA